MLRDEKTRKSLLALGYQYWEVWECELLRNDFTQLDDFVESYRRVRGIVQ